jgi:hypothetical protein
MKAADSSPDGRLTPKKGPAEFFAISGSSGGGLGLEIPLTGSTLVVMVDIKKIVNVIIITFLFSIG